MHKPGPPEALPLACAAQIVSQLSVMRRECSQLAGHLMIHRPGDERRVTDCVRLDSALANAHGILVDAVKAIHPPSSHDLSLKSDSACRNAGVKARLF